MKKITNSIMQVESVVNPTTLVLVVAAMATDTNMNMGRDMDMDTVLII